MVEIAQYELLKQTDNLEIRKYPACIMATTELPIENRNNAFRRVASYNFGSNNQNKKIAMTAPVVMTNSRKKFTMAFIMPKQYEMSNLPKPKNNDVVLKKVPSRTLAVIRYSGLMGQDRIMQKTKQLLDSIKKQKLTSKGEPFFMGYNAPWTLPFLRRNEVAVEVINY
jgi:hypothetical protein